MLRRLVAFPRFWRKFGSEIPLAKLTLPSSSFSKTRQEHDSGGLGPPGAGGAVGQREPPQLAAAS